MRILIILFFSFNLYGFESCGLYEITGKVNCSKDHCLLITSPDTLSEKVSLISNMNPRDYSGVSFYLAANINVNNIINYKQSVVDVLKLHVLDEEKYFRNYLTPQKLIERKCE